ncbi:hypothetical protein [Alteromonas facilis]|uniref:hypothetical protein n=1 Tax=Alteromonas facilis TaxID=2048004 RepID=UPI000C2894E8|nr:hypothetical protein [Alteromonas facilis]
MQFILLMLLIILSTFVQAGEKIDLNAFANQYFDKMVATQFPNASEKDLDEYLALLKDDVGHSHLPWVTDDTRYLDGKKSMKKGMKHYLGSHTRFKAELLNVFTFNSSAIAVRYKKQVSGTHPDNNQPIEYERTIMEVLELEGGKVAVIRKYHE